MDLAFRERSVDAERKRRRDLRSLEPRDGPFAIRNLWAPSVFPLQSLEPLEKPTWDEKFPDLARGVFQSPLDLFGKNDAALYTLNIFGDDPFEPVDIPSLQASIPSEGGPDLGDLDDSSEHASDIWDAPSLLKSTHNATVLRSWDSFPNHDHDQRQAVFLSETGRRGFDAALEVQGTKSGLENSGRVARTDPFLFSLLKLGLGWNSPFFRYNEKARRFEKDVKDARISGISLPALDSLIHEFLECGTHVREIRRFIASIPSRTNPSPPLSALARASFLVQYSVEDQLLRRSGPSMSLLELQELFRRCGCLMRCLRDVIGGATEAASDAAVVSMVFKKCDDFSQEIVWLADILHELMTLVAKPWLSLISTWVGIRTHSHEPTAAGIDRDSDGLVVTARDIPDFVPPENQGLILETGRILRLLREYHPDHALSKNWDSAPDPVSLSFECATAWDDIDRIQRRASAYEAQLRSEILKYRQTPDDPGRNLDQGSVGADPRRDEHEPTDQIYELSSLNGPLDVTQALGSECPMSSHKLYTLLEESQCLDPASKLVDEAPFGPPPALSIYLSFSPIISAQARLVSFSLLQVLFNSHGIREHLGLQYRFQLLGDSAFLSRLSSTLFDPDMQSGERKRGVARSGLSTGLRLGHRDTWPPASSELRLVMMGVLTECYENGNKGGQSRIDQVKATDVELPGDLSFAIRELTEEEILNCKNPNAIEALDFLRLQYSPPPILDEIITPRSLRRYDRLFKQLLRVARMLSVVRRLVRDATSRHPNIDPSNMERRFRFEAMHFIQCLSDYTFNVGIADTWRKFDKSLQKIEQCINEGNIDSTLEHVQNPAKLREYHEDVLEQMLIALFLTKKHAPLSRQIENIFGVILTYDAICRSGDNRGPDYSERYERSASKLYAKFKHHVALFVNLLKTLDGGKLTMSRGGHRDLADWGSGQTPDMDVNGVFEHLLIRLIMKEYY